ncbi:MAG: VRR-NUC domain-containing protein [Deltaproteobacteria bacterium]|nr:VRR-NUC domain-containing protein [Deltaproteobacteria bacterium]
MGRRGVSDIVGCLPGSGRMICVEVKTDRGRVTEYQQQFIEDVNRSGGLGFVARSVEDVRDKLETVGISSPQQRLF